MGTAPIAKSGWHVYNNMEQILDKKTWTDNHPFHLSDRTYEKHMLPQTDDILDRAVNISIGVVDKGLGSGCGININSTEEEINATAKHDVSLEGLNVKMEAKVSATVKGNAKAELSASGQTTVKGAMVMIN